jgi:hypothetical protein
VKVTYESLVGSKVKANTMKLVFVASLLTTKC